MRGRLFAICFCTLVSVGLCGRTALLASFDKERPLADPATQSAELAKIKAYHDEIDAYARRHPTAVRYFSVKDAEDGTSTWKEYRTKKELPELETHASVWMKDGRVVATIFSFKSDHTNSTDGSYFRPDGTLAYRELHGYSIGLDPPFMESKSYYSSAGKILSSKMLCSIDDRKWTNCQADSGWKATDEGGDKQLYLKNTALPFYGLLGKGY